MKCTVRPRGGPRSEFLGKPVHLRFAATAAAMLFTIGAGGSEVPPPPHAKASPGSGPTVDWHLTWQGWNGLHYRLHARRGEGRGKAWTNDPEKPAFPSLFMDHVRLDGKIGGRVDFDTAYFVDSTGAGPHGIRMELRRWRFFATGEAIVLVPFAYSVNIMAVNNYQFVLDDVYLEFRRIPYLGTLRVGAFIPAMSLEASGSSRDATFMEWGTPIQGLAPRISAGWQLRRPYLGERATWSIGQFAQSLGTDVGDATRDFYRAIARFTWLPIYETLPETRVPRRLLHLGLNLNYLYSGNATIRYRSRPESNTAPFLADTGEVPASGMSSFGLEASWVDGPWSFQTEYLNNFISESGLQSFYGVYAYGSYFWTGESRRYDTGRGVFGRLIPNRNFSFGEDGGSGALETALRFSYLDLDSGPVRGGKLATVTAGLNWYPIPNTKFRFNYVYAHAEGGPRPGDLNILQTRIEFDF